MSTYTQNKGLEQPANGSYNDDWDVPVNTDWAAIDACFGGVTGIGVTGIAQGVYSLTLAQYQPPNIEFSGTLSGNLYYTIPPGVGGTWSVYNNTSGAFQVWFCINGYSNYLLPQGFRSLVISDGYSMQAADSALGNATLTAAETYATAVAGNAQANAEAYTNASSANAIATAEGYTDNSSANTLAAAETYALAQATALSAAAQAAAISTSEAYTRTFVGGTVKAGSFSCTNGVVTVTFAAPFASSCTSVIVQWEYANPDVGWVVPGSRSKTGFQYQNGNAGACTYIAVGT